MTLAFSALWFFDLPLVLTLLWLAWTLLHTADLFTSVVLFIAFGFLMAIAWARLSAPDVALAEAAIGAGLTGALFLSAVKTREAAGSVVASWPLRGALTSFGLILMIAIAWPLFSLPTLAHGLGPEVRAQLPNSGVESPVTAVLLNFRAYDTLLEVAVLLLAVLPVWARESVAERDNQPGLLLRALVQLVVPLAIIAGSWLLWSGARRPGGAFQGGAILAAACVLLLLSNMGRPQAVPKWMLRVALGLGLSTFVLVAAILTISGAALLEYPGQWAGHILLLIEVALVVSIAVTLGLLFMGGRPRR